MEIVVFAGGNGLRMLPHTKTQNKVLLKYKNIPILHKCIEPFIDLGYNRITLLTSFLAAGVEEFAINSFPKEVNLNIIRGNINLNSRIIQVQPFNNKGIITVHGNIILKKNVIKRFIDRAKYYNGDFLMLTSKVRENFCPGHPFVYNFKRQQRCVLGQPDKKVKGLRCCIGLNYMSQKSLNLLRQHQNLFFPEELLTSNLIGFDEQTTNSKIKHFENEKDLH